MMSQRLAAPFVTATFNISNYSIFLSTFQIIAVVSSMLTVTVFMATKASKWLNPVTTLTIGLSTFLVMHASSYPWMSFHSSPVVPKDATHKLGCDSATYSWCEGMWIVDPWSWVVVSGALIGIGFDTIYSRELGNIDQNIMQAMLIVFVDLASGFLPVLATTCFKLYGPNKWWLGVVGVMAGGIVLLFFLNPRLKKQESLAVAEGKESAD